MPRIVEEKITETLLKIKMEEINVMREKESTDTKRKNKLKTLNATDCSSGLCNISCDIFN